VPNQTPNASGLRRGQIEMKHDRNKEIERFLREHPNQPFRSRAIAEWLIKQFPAVYKEKKKSSERIKKKRQLMTQVASEITSKRDRLQNRFPKIKTKENPRQFYWTDKKDEEIEEVKSQDANKQKESDLYPLLAKYLMSEFQIYSMRIDEKASRNSRGHKGNEWLHPDVVGLHDLTEGWEQEVRNVVNSHDKASIWSFEVKKNLYASNVRSAFFQAVSNSSWANFGYLVASDIDGEGTMKELRLLSGLHGIGFIQIDSEDPVENSQVVIPARERLQVNCATCNRLASENPDFREFLVRIDNFNRSTNGRIQSDGWLV